MLWQSFLWWIACSVLTCGDSPHFHIIMHMHDISGIGLECSEIANFEMGRTFTTILVRTSLAGQTIFRGCEEYSLVKLHRLTCFDLP